MNKSVDIIIPTYRPDETVVYLIKKLLKQTYPIHEIHIIDTETGIFPKELKNLSDKIRISKIKPEQFDHGGTRHEGAMQSHTDIIVYMTQDAMPVNEYLIEELVKAFDNEKIAAAYARQLPNSKCNVIERYTRAFNYPEQSRIKSMEDLETLGIKTYFCSDVCAAYRKSVYESLGGFEEKTIFNEDMIMAAKIIQSGGLVKYVAEAKVIHSHNYNCKQQFQRNFDLAVSQVEHPEVFQNIKSESEGMRLVKNTMIYLIKIKKPWLIIKLISQSGFKYMGYCLGRKYSQLPMWLIKKCTMNQRYW
ncbi:MULTISPECIES: glycosyltransferase [Clostridia]|jgi:rhamnosyltransferase|uniref:glycosyltransferase n=1 Tax=Clostridia TaxID=186801 RepID=UPI000E4E6330|nr:MULTISPECIES: glycosyltransferase family 2 protein [Clostridia]RGH41830.1 glycosyltransferase family 2 protein [Firmicutes bacterium AM41-5BH]RHV07283.1 glycosyltransferase family 2 protein [Firmicutes bacterium OM07-11]RKQ31881.1 glycosyltransferase [Ruminococcus sp. B05]TAP36122.1 glycosyltransferase family 2 protein [Mediterraneibacter sp. gm002]